MANNRAFTQNIKPYHASIPLLLLSFFLLLLIILGDKIVTPIHNTPGIFRHQGTVVNNIDSWNLVTTFDISLIWSKLDYLKHTTRTLEKSYLHRNNDNCIAQIISTEELSLLQRDLLILEQSTGTRRTKRQVEVNDRASLRRYRRAILPFGSKILKFLYGTPNVDDAISYNERFEKLYNNQHKKDELAAHQYKAVSSLFTFADKARQEFMTLHLRLEDSINHINQSLNFQFIESKLNQMISAIKEDITLMENAVSFARRNILHPRIINETTFRRTLLSIRLPDNRQ